MTKQTALAFAFSTAIGIATVGGAYSQQTTTPPSTPITPPVTMPAPTPPAAGAPVAGANSFTETQAKARLETQGFTAVSGLTKDKDGIWRGKATKAGRGLNVSVDYQGNIVEN
jgi:hypothetical protein